MNTGLERVGRARENTENRRTPARAVAWTSPQITQWMRERIKAGDGNPSVVPDEPFRFLRLPEVEQRTGLRRSSIYRRIAEGTFPPPVRLGEPQ